MLRPQKYIYMKRELINKRHQGTRKKIIGDLVNWRIQIKKSMEEEASHLENRMLYCLFCLLPIIDSCSSPHMHAKLICTNPESEEITEEKPERKRCKSCAKENRCTRPQEWRRRWRYGEETWSRPSTPFVFCSLTGRASFFVASAHRRGLGFGAPMGHPGGFLFANFIFNFFARGGFLAAHEINPNYVSFWNLANQGPGNWVI